MNSPLQRAKLAFDQLSPRQPALRSSPPPQQSDAPALAREIAEHSSELSRTLATVVKTGASTATTTHLISSSLNAQHAIIRRTFGLSSP